VGRRHYIMTYDISDDKRRTKVFNVLRDNGDHVQYSVFICQLNKMELTSLRTSMLSYIDKRKDQILIIDLGSSQNPLEADIECLGQRYEPPSRVTVV